MAIDQFNRNQPPTCPRGVHTAAESPRDLCLVPQADSPGGNERWIVSGSRSRNKEHCWTPVQRDLDGALAEQSRLSDAGGGAAPKPHCLTAKNH